MGSVVLGDFVPARTGLSYTMLAGKPTQQSHLLQAEAIYPSSRPTPPESRSSHSASPEDEPASRTTPRHTKSSRAPDVSAAPSQQQQLHAPPPPTTDPIPSPRVRANSHPTSIEPSSSELNPTHGQPRPHQPPNRDPYTRETPPYESASAYLPSNRTSAAGPSAASPSHASSTSRPRVGAQHMLQTPNCVKVRDLTHIQQLARDELLRGGSGAGVGSSAGVDDVGTKYDISAMSVTDVIEMVAGLLTKITTTNDRQHEHLHQHIPPTDGAAPLSPQTSSVLSFHGKNVPTITISSYLTRIHRYCPTTYEVFLGLLVYFDRMTERVNFGSPAQQHQQRQDTQPSSSKGVDEGRGSGGAALASTSIVTPPSSIPTEGVDQSGMPPSPSTSTETSLNAMNQTAPTQFFVVDSYNIHRLIIAGVTCASKFFSDVFYTNSRYAKVS